MSLIQRVTALAQAVAADIKALYAGKAEKGHTHTTAQITGLDSALESKASKAELTGALDLKVDKVTGKGLSDTNFTQLEKTKLSGIATGGNNTALGVYTLMGNITGEYNTALGAGALSRNDSGSHNTALGYGTLMGNTTGEYNTALGVYALRYSERGSNNTALGRNALGFNEYYNNCSGLGYASQVTASNQIQLGNASTTVYAYGAVQNRSDARDKAEVRDTVLGLDFINAIRPVDYKLDMREDYRVELGDNPTEEQLEANKLANIKADGTHTRKRYHHGVIAQEVASVIAALGVDFGGFQDHSKNGGEDVLSIGYEEFIAPLIKAVQELSAKVKALEGKVEHE